LDRHKSAATGFSYGATDQRPVFERIRRWFSALGAETLEIIRLARQEKLTLLLAWLLVFMLIGSIVFYFDALYWSIVSITTVGYGDLAPTTAGARTVSVLMLLSFMALMPVVGATITSIYVSKKIKEERGLDTITFGQHIVICGWNNNGHNVLAGLQEQEPQTPVVIVGELDQDHFENIAGGFPQLNLHFVRGKYTNEATLRRANVRQAKVALVLISYSMDSLMRSDETAVLTVLTLRELGPNLRIVARSRTR
jgi:voltage-gated potassium channel